MLGPVETGRMPGSAYSVERWRGESGKSTAPLSRVEAVSAYSEDRNFLTENGSVRVSISDQARAAQANQDLRDQGLTDPQTKSETKSQRGASKDAKASQPPGQESSPAENPEKSSSSSGFSATKATPGGQELSQEEEEMLRELQARDSEVRAHEAAHQASGAGLTGGASFSTQKGPDGKDYAVGGEVSIDVSSGSTPQETIAKAQKVRAAALAPADPSPQDRAVAAQAMQMESQARMELLEFQEKEREQELASREEKKNDSAGPVGRFAADAARAITAYSQQY